ncbi:hypothetical protein HWV62_37956 [Athelia sp. TMB]|nr:hypothetical protein HWV62_37956 [Athelia sp. TMB]
MRRSKITSTSVLPDGGGSAFLPPSEPNFAVLKRASLDFSLSPRHARILQITRINGPRADAAHGTCDKLAQQPATILRAGLEWVGLRARPAVARGMDIWRGTHPSPIRPHPTLTYAPPWAVLGDLRMGHGDSDRWDLPVKQPARDC